MIHNKTKQRQTKPHTMKYFSNMNKKIHNSPSMLILATRCFAALRQNNMKSGRWSKENITKNEQN